MADAGQGFDVIETNEFFFISINSKNIKKIDGVVVLTLPSPVFVVQYRCKKCGEVFYPRTPKPVLCPNCKCRTWWEDKR